MRKKEIEPIRVLQFTSQLSAGGVQSFLLNYSSNMNNDKVVFDYVVQTDKECEYDSLVRKKGSVIYHVTSMNVSKIRYMIEVYQILKKHSEYDIVHANLNFRNIFPLFSAKKAGVKTRISHSHSNYEASNILKRILRMGFRILLPMVATDYWACSTVAGNCLYGRYKNFTVVHNAIQTEKFLFSEYYRNSIREKLNVNEKEVWLHVGMFGKVKNHAFLIDLFNMYLKRFPNTILILCGDGKERKSIETKVDEYNISDNVIFTGKINNVNEYYSAADVMVCPSLYEGFPLVCIEAQASGCAIVASNAIPDEALWNNNTIKCQDWNLNKWEDSVIKVIESGFDRTNTILNCKNLKYDIKNESHKLENAYLNFYKENRE